MSQSIELRVIEVIAKVLEISPSEISMNQPVKELFESSLDQVQLLFEIEETFNISIEDYTKELSTVRDIVIEIEKLVLQEPALKEEVV